MAEQHDSNESPSFTVYALRRGRRWVAVTWDRERNLCLVNLRAGGCYYYSPASTRTLREARDDSAAHTYSTLAALREDYPDVERWEEQDRQPRRAAEVPVLRLRKNTTLTLSDRSRRRLAELQEETGLAWSRIVEYAIDEWKPVIGVEEIAERGGRIVEQPPRR